MSGVYINPRFEISSASSDGTNLTYICNNNFLAGQRIVVSGSSNPEFDTEDSALVSATSTQFVIENKSVSSSATSTGGLAYDITGEWKNTGTVYAKVSGQWRIVGETFAKINGVWRRTTLGAPPNAPIMEYVSTGLFKISNYDPNLTYQAVLVEGRSDISGNAFLNTSTGVYTLDGANSAFNVYSSYAPGAPRSQPGFMERKKYRFDFRDIIGQCCSSGGPCSTVCNGFCSTDPCGGYGQCGCSAPAIWFCGTVDVSCPPPNCSPCVTGRVQDVLINEPGYKNSGTEWYKDDV